MIAARRTVCCECGETVDLSWGKLFRSILHNQPDLASRATQEPGNRCQPNCIDQSKAHKPHVKLLCEDCWNQNYEMTPDGAISTYTEEWEQWFEDKITAKEAIEIQRRKVKK